MFLYTLDSNKSHLLNQSSEDDLNSETLDAASSYERQKHSYKYIASRKKEDTYLDTNPSV